MKKGKYPLKGMKILICIKVVGMHFKLQQWHFEVAFNNLTTTEPTELTETRPTL
jgi:hypothetical protein